MTDREPLRAEIKALGERVDLKLAILGKDLTSTVTELERVAKNLRAFARQQRALVDELRRETQ